MNIPVINIENFRQWLESKVEYEIIGVKASCGKCPIALYLNENFPFEDYHWWLVNGEHYYKNGTSDVNILMLPEWAKEFVSQIDDLKTKDNYVDREHCLNVLDKLTV